jgi:hypothetical protein
VEHCAGFIFARRLRVMSSQLSFLEPKTTHPEGFQYEPQLLNEAEERTFVGDLERLPFKEFAFHGFTG